MGPLAVGWSDRMRVFVGSMLFLVGIAAGSAYAQEYIGPSRCFGCHKMGKTAWQASHEKTLNQLSEPKAAEYAKATGGDPKHPKCLVCHAPVKLAAGPASVSCETCHGPAKGWFNPHKDSPFYALPAAQQQGMVILYKEAAKIAKLCVDCHVLNDKAMADAGHPVGEKFDAGKDLSVPKMVHWPSGTAGEARPRAYDKAFYASVTGAGRPILTARVAAAGGPSRAAGKPPAGGPPPPVGGTPPKATGPAPVARPTKATPPPAGNDEYADLGDDEFLETKADAPPPPDPVTPQNTVAPAPPAPTTPKVRPIERLPLPDAPSGAFEAPPVVVRTRPAAPATAGGTEPPPAAPRVARNPAELRGRAAVVLGELIRQKKQLALPPPAPPAEFTGPDGELLHLQDAVLALALETLRKSP
jgi:hypothetical protein